MSRLPTDRTVFQNAWVCDDVEATAMQWVKTTGVGPFFIAEHGPGTLANTQYRGEDAELRMRVAIAQAGPVQIELIQPLGDGANCYRDTVSSGRTQFHHVCVWTDDLDADMAHYQAAGCPIASSGEVIGGPRFCYVDAQAQISCMIEILERDRRVERVFRMIADANENWDGTRPIRGYA